MMRFRLGGKCLAEMKRSAAVAGLLAAAFLGGPAVLAGAAAKGDSQEAPANKKPAAGEKININTASAEQLESLPGIGPALAQRILDYRKQNGAFKKAEELLNVKGIGEKSYERLKDRITVGS